MTRLGRAAIASITTAAFVATGCAGREWPSTFTGSADPGFASHRLAVATIDVLPVDLEVWSHPGRTEDANAVRAGAESAAVGAVSGLLYRDGFQVASIIDWSGRASGAPGAPPALAPADLLATLDVLGSYGAATANRSDGLPDPALPATLGTVSHADATLYIGGWSYLGRRDTGSGDKIAKGLLIAVAIVAVVVIIAAIADSKGGKKKGGGSSVGNERAGDNWRGSGNHGGRRFGDLVPLRRVAAATGRVALRTLAAAGRASLQISSDALDATAEGMARNPTYVQIGPGSAPCSPYPCSASPPPPPPSPPPAPSRCPVAGPDGDPDGCYIQPRASVPSDGPSVLYLEATLVDNHTGRALWHSHQFFPADASKPREVQRAIAGVMSTLPRAN